MKNVMLSHTGRYLRRSALAAIVSVASCIGAFAQIGSGYTWTSYASGAFIQFQIDGSYSSFPLKQDVSRSDGVYDYTSSTNTEKFILKGSHVNRIEYQGRSYSSGVYQFEGWVRVNDSATDHVSICQAFHCVLLKWYARDGGTIRYHSASDFSGTPAELGRDIKTSARGDWTKVNMIHDASNNRITVYIDGVKRVDNYPTGDTGNFYFKYGAYDASGSDDETIEWRNVRVFKRS
jgi:hypothetical protein